jgi:NADPH-ferrihemoprotein reductase
LSPPPQSKRCVIFYGSQTGTAEEYAIRLAKEAKSRFGISSLVCDPEEYDFQRLDQVPETSVVFFVVATYGEGEPTDNAQPLMEFLMDENVEFSQGREGEGEALKNLRYVVFGLGNRTYEHYNEIGRKIDARLTALGGKRIGLVGEGDDDKSMEEDYLAWKDGMWEQFQKELNIEEGGSGDSADFQVKELEEGEISADKVYHGELSARALLGSKGTHDAKNPFPAKVSVAKELFAIDAERNCVHVEFDITDSGMSYQHGDHVGVWPSNPDVEVDRMLCVLGIASEQRRHTAVNIVSLDPALAKVPFPTPATYDAIFRHYLDISAVASRQTLAMLARYAPTPEIADKLSRLGTDKDAYHAEVDGPALKLAEVLQAMAGDDLSAAPTENNVTVWSNIPFDRIVSSVTRLQPRYYSISSSSKLYPNSIHVTAVVLKYESQPSSAHRNRTRLVYGVGTNFILNVKLAHSGETAPLLAEPSRNQPGLVSSTAGWLTPPTYKIAGPRNAYLRDDKYLVPVHVRRSTFRLPTSPKVPIIMIGPGTGVAPFRGFVQERVAAARKAMAKAGADVTTQEALKDWADMYLFYGCRKEDEDFLYRDEWPQAIQELGGKLKMEVAFSRGGRRKPDGSE